jgi:hypothetical protein
MRYFTVLLFLLAGSFLLLPACAQKATSAAQQAKPKKISKKAAAQQARSQAQKAKQEAGPVLIFERTRCLGRCPAYRMQVFADGRVTYEGRHSVPDMGTKELKLAPAALADMLRTAEEAHFGQFQDRYTKGTSDLPGTIIAIRQPNGQLKTVLVEEGEPTNVKQLVAYLTTRFDALAQLNPDR